MFGIFKRKPAGPKVIDRVYTSMAAKWRACKTLSTENTVFIAWFPDTLEDFTASTGLSGVLARESHGLRHNNGNIVFVEHYLLRAPEEKLFADLALPEVLVLSALDEPFFHYFSGNRIADLIKNFGLDPDEPVEHAMISKSIQTAQEKLAEKMLVDHYTTSQKKWFDNL
jgi:hypothetical protein